jgi:hypothetical protein
MSRNSITDSTLQEPAADKDIGHIGAAPIEDLKKTWTQGYHNSVETKFISQDKNEWDKQIEKDLLLVMRGDFARRVQAKPCNFHSLLESSS